MTDHGLAKPLALFSALGMAACGGTTTAVDRNVEPRVTIVTGVYGQTTEYNDVGAQNMPVYKQMDLKLLDAGGATVTTMTSADQGFYEAAVDTGSYRICTSFDRCQAITVQVMKKVRCDYEFSIGPGWNCVAK